MLCVVPLLSFLFILHPPLFLSSVSLSFLCPTASSQPSFLVSLHTTDWSPSLSANSFTPQSKPKLGVARWLTPTSRYSYSLAGNIREPKFGSSVLPPFFLSPPCLVFFYFFGTCFSSFFCYVRQTEVEQASKWMAKPPFPLLALLFMHVIPVPAPPPLPPSLSILICLFSLLHPSSIFSYYCTFIYFCLMGAITQFSLHFLYVVWPSGWYPQTLSLSPWPNRAGSDRRKGMKGQFLEAETLWKGDRSHYVCLFLLSALVVSNTEWYRDEWGAPSLWLPVSEPEHQR